MGSATEGGEEEEQSRKVGSSTRPRLTCALARAPFLWHTATKEGLHNGQRPSILTGLRQQIVHYIHSYSWFAGGNSNTTSLPVKRRYTDENESNLYSSDVASFESRILHWRSA